MRDISRLVALAGPAVLAIDQIDTLLAQSVRAHRRRGRDDGDGALEHVAHGLMSIRQTMRRTVAVVACLPSAWEAIRDRATATVHGPVPGDRAAARRCRPRDIGRAILERRFAASYGAVDFTPPYPSWPILPSAFDDAAGLHPAPAADPRRHPRPAMPACATRSTNSPTSATSPPSRRSLGRPTNRLRTPRPIDRRFADYRGRAVPAAALDPDGEDTTVPALLGAALTAWITERGDDSSPTACDPPPGRRWCCTLGCGRAWTPPPTTNGTGRSGRSAPPTRSPRRTASRRPSVAAGFGSGADQRRLFLLRNTPWPSGAKTAELVADFERAGGRTLTLSDDDLRTMSALRDLHRRGRTPTWPDWLRARKPAHGIALLREALGDDDRRPRPPRS